MSDGTRIMDGLSLPAAGAGSAAPAAPAGRSEFGRVLRKLGATGPLALLALLLPAVGGFVLLLGYLNPVAEWLRINGPMGLLIYVASFMLLGGVALLPTYANSILAGYAFGFQAGYPAAMLGLVLASTLAYAIARRLSADNVSEVLREHPKWQAVRDALLAGGFWKVLLIITLLRLPPNSPFAMSNLVMAAARVRLAPYMLGTLIGMAPRTGVTVFAVAGIAQLDFELRQQTGLFIAGLAVTFIVIVIIGVLAKRAVARVTASHGPSAPVTVAPDARHRD